MKRWIFCIGLIAFIGCDEDLYDPPIREVPVLPSVEAEGIRAAVVLERNDRDAVVLVVRFDQNAEMLGAYQGSLTFDAEAFDFVDASVSEDGYRLHNPATAGDGVIKFAGFSVDGFAEREALRVHLVPNDKFDPTAIGLEIDVVGTLEGVAVPDDRLAVLPGVYRELNDTKY